LTNQIVFLVSMLVKLENYHREWRYKVPKSTGCLIKSTVNPFLFKVGILLISFYNPFKRDSIFNYLHFQNYFIYHFAILDFFTVTEKRTTYIGFMNRESEKSAFQRTVIYYPLEGTKSHNGLHWKSTKQYFFVSNIKWPLSFI